MSEISSKPDWMTGSPWRELRAHASINPNESSHSFIEIEELRIDGKHPRWTLSARNQACLEIPTHMGSGRKTQYGSERLLVEHIYREGSRWLVLTCIDADLEDVFLKLCDTTLSEIAESRMPEAALEKVLLRFRNFFLAQPSRVSHEKIMGLFSELVTLEWLLECGVDAIPSWIGSDGETHDFAFGPLHLEIKTLPPSGEERVKISNIYQLEIPANGLLYLIGVLLPPGQFSLADQYEKVRALASPESLQRLEEKMVKSGCPLPIGREWLHVSFAPDKPKAWAVSDGFPRLTPQMLPNGVVPDGVSAIKYSVSVARATPFAVSPQNVVDKILEASAI